MNWPIILAIPAGVGVIWNVVTSLLIFSSLQRRGIPVSFIWLRALAPKYANQYRVITRRESGKTGPLFYHWIISINLALVFAVAAILVEMT
jgi:hypothetical protein